MYASAYLYLLLLLLLLFRFVPSLEVGRGLHTFDFCVAFFYPAKIAILIDRLVGMCWCIIASRKLNESF